MLIMKSERDCILVNCQEDIQLIEGLEESDVDGNHIRIAGLPVMKNILVPRGKAILFYGGKLYQFNLRKEDDASIC